MANQHPYKKRRCKQPEHRIHITRNPPTLAVTLHHPVRRKQWQILALRLWTLRGAVDAIVHPAVNHCARLAEPFATEQAAGDRNAFAVCVADELRF
jgi:hypothetical protein